MRVVFVSCLVMATLVDLGRVCAAPDPSEDGSWWGYGQRAWGAVQETAQGVAASGWNAACAAGDAAQGAWNADWAGAGNAAWGAAKEFGKSFNPSYVTEVQQGEHEHWVNEEKERLQKSGKTVPDGHIPVQVVNVLPESTKDLGIGCGVRTETISKDEAEAPVNAGPRLREICEGSSSLFGYARGAWNGWCEMSAIKKSCAVFFWGAGVLAVGGTLAVLTPFAIPVAVLGGMCALGGAICGLKSYKAIWG